MEKVYQRIKFYQHGWSNFDAIEECSKPKFCVGCTYKHPVCDKNGRVSNPAELSAKKQ